MVPNDAIEQLANLLDFARRRWLLLLLPLLICLPIAYSMVKLTPKVYTAKSAILLRPAQQLGGAQSPGTALEQLIAVEAWLKSDQVMIDLLPLAGEGPSPRTTEELHFAIKRLQSAINLKLEGNSVLVVELNGANARGLGRRLELILAHLMEGLLRPDNGLLSAEQLIVLSSNEAAQNAEENLFRTIEAAGHKDPSVVIEQLAALVAKEREVASARTAIGADETNALEKKLELEQLRGAITENPADLKRIRTAYDAFERARAAREASQKLWSSHNINYPGIFESPEKLTLIGRPRDPLFGENPSKKYAIAAAFISLLIGLALAVLAELFDPRLRSRREVEALTGLPVVARVTLAKD